MKLFKFRRFSPFEHLADIVVNHRLYCSEYSDLNDPFEGVFLLTFPGAFSSGFGPGFNIGGNHEPREVNGIDPRISKVRICSLSSSIEDVRLWSHYADGHKGVAIEIDFSGIESVVNEVSYSTSLPHYDTTLPTEQPDPVKILCSKTDHWAYEAEYRLLHDSEYFDVTNRITAIHVGMRMPKNNHELLRSILAPEISVFSTTLDSKDVTVKSSR